MIAAVAVSYRQAVPSQLGLVLPLASFGFAPSHQEREDQELERSGTSGAGAATFNAKRSS
jgi:hypothetical protein